MLLRQAARLLKLRRHASDMTMMVVHVCARLACLYVGVWKGNRAERMHLLIRCEVVQRWRINCHMYTAMCWHAVPLDTQLPDKLLLGCVMKGKTWRSACLSSCVFLLMCVACSLISSLALPCPGHCVPSAEVELLHRLPILIIR